MQRVYLAGLQEKVALAGELLLGQFLGAGKRSRRLCLLALHTQDRTVEDEGLTKLPILGGGDSEQP